MEHIKNTRLIGRKIALYIRWGHKEAPRFIDSVIHHIVPEKLFRPITMHYDRLKGAATFRFRTKSDYDMGFSYLRSIDSQLDKIENF